MRKINVCNEVKNKMSTSQKKPTFLKKSHKPFIYAVCGTFKFLMGHFSFNDNKKKFLSNKHKGLL